MMDWTGFLFGCVSLQLDTDLHLNLGLDYLIQSLGEKDDQSID